MTVKETIDIERLLGWAYRVQCVDKQVSALRRHGPSSSATAGLGRFVELGTKVDNSGAAAQALGVRVADDAVIVHDAVHSAGEMWLEWHADDEVEIWDRERAAAAGQAIDRYQGQWLRRPITPSGRVAAFGIRLEQAATQAMLIIHAKNGTRPDWYEGWSAPEGRPAQDCLAFDRRGRLRKRSEAASVEDVMHARALYAVWRAALALVAIDLAGTLRGYDVIGPAAPENPWLLAPKRVLNGVQCQNSSVDNHLRLLAKK